MIKNISQKLFQVYAFLVHKLTAGNAHNIHSPFVFNLYKEVFATKNAFYIFLPIEKLRKNLLKNSNDVAIKDFGTGKNRKSSIASIAKKATKPAFQAQFLFRLVNFLQIKNGIELGTNLGLTTCYLAAANTKSKIVTLEGNQPFITIAKENAKLLKLTNIDFVMGNFDVTLPQLLNNDTQYDFAYIDGNHTYEATLAYYKLLVKSNVKVIVLDDIYWSTGMNKAWKEIINNSEIKLSIDLYYMGIVIFRDEISYSENFKLLL